MSICGVIMVLITGLEMNTKKNRARLYIDGAYVFSISVEVALKKKLRIGMEISENQIETLREDDEICRCKESAFRLLDFRARSEKELRDRLARKGFGLEVIGKTMEGLKASRLIDDVEFGRQWAESRQNFRPQSAFLTRRELKDKGLSEEAIAQAVENYDDYENALSAARPRAMKYTGIEYPIFQRRIGSFLQRRGFGYGVIKPIINKLWKEVIQYQNSGENLQ